MQDILVCDFENAELLTVAYCEHPEEIQDVVIRKIGLREVVIADVESVKCLSNVLRRSPVDSGPNAKAPHQFTKGSYVDREEVCCRKGNFGSRIRNPVDSDSHLLLLWNQFFITLCSKYIYVRIMQYEISIGGIDQHLNDTAVCEHPSRNDWKRYDPKGRESAAKDFEFPAAQCI